MWDIYWDEATLPIHFKVQCHCGARRKLLFTHLEQIRACPNCGRIVRLSKSLKRILVEQYTQRKQQ
jgi:hypothetical protein